MHVAWAAGPFLLNLTVANALCSFIAVQWVSGCSLLISQLCGIRTHARPGGPWDADFNLRWFQHRAFYDARGRRTERQLVSLRDQAVSIGGLRITLKAYETIRTARYSQNLLPGFSRLAEASGLRVKRGWFHAQGFTVQYLEPVALEKEASCTTKEAC